MKAVLKWVAVAAICLMTVVTASFLGTRGDYAVARLVTDDPTLPRKRVAGVNLHMRKLEGPSKAPTIIVLHGGPGGDFRSLQALEALSDRYHVVFYDQRGAGLSERVPAELLTLDGYLNELQSVIELVSPDQPPILIGHSWGAMLAAGYIGENPDQVQSAVLIEPGYLDAAGRDAWEAESARYMSGPLYLWEAIITGFRAQHVARQDKAARQDFIVGHMVDHFANHPDNPYHCGAGYTVPHWRFGALSSGIWRDAPASAVDRLGAGTMAFSGPVLLVRGSCNAWLGPVQEQNLARFANADMTIIPKAGHDVVWDNPDATLAAIRDFLN